MLLLLVVFPVIGVTGMMLPRRSVKTPLVAAIWLQLVQLVQKLLADIDRRHIGDDADVELCGRGDGVGESVDKLSWRRL